MGIIRIVKTAKEVHKNDIILVKIGKFYQVYGKDAYINLKIRIENINTFLLENIDKQDFKNILN